MSLSSAVVISAFTLFAPSSDVAKQAPVFSPELATQIEQRAEVNQIKDSFTRTLESNDQIAANIPVERLIYSMDKQEKSLAERVAVALPLESSSIHATQPCERNESTTLAVYPDNQGKQGKESPMFAVYPQPERTERLAHKDGGIQNEQWTTAFTSPERNEMGKLA